MQLKIVKIILDIYLDHKYQIIFKTIGVFLKKLFLFTMFFFNMLSILFFLYCLINVQNITLLTLNLILIAFYYCIIIKFSSVLQMLIEHFKMISSLKCLYKYYFFIIHLILLIIHVTIPLIAFNYIILFIFL